MASCFFLLEQFDDVIVYMESIKSYFYNDDTFNYLYGQTLASTGKWEEAEESLQLISSPKLKTDYAYVSWLARCYIMNSKPRMAWELYTEQDSSTDSYNLLVLIANDCYEMGQFIYAAKAFDVLEQLDPNPEYWQGKRGACAGVFQMIIAGHEPKESLREVIMMLTKDGEPVNQGADWIIKVMTDWADAENVRLD